MNQQPQSKDFNVAIVGGGMCGLVLAIALNRAGIEVDLFESASKFGEAGAGVGLGPNAIRVLEKLGVMDAVRIHSGQTPAEYLCSFYPGHEEPKEHGYDPIHIYETTSEDLGLPIHRATFLGALVHLLPAHCVHFRKRCTQATYLQTSDEYLIKFSDGTTHTADVVVGADGIRSTLRKVMLRYNSGYSTGNMDEDCSALKDEHLSFSGDIAYRSLIPTQELRDAGVKLDMGRTLAICGNNQHFITFPVLSGEKLNIVAFTHDKAAATPSNRAPLPQPWTESDVSVSNLLGEFTSWNKDITTIVQHLKSPSKWYIHALDPPLETYVARDAPAGGRMVLVGDAAHAMTTHLGAGVGQGFEDIFVLWSLLTLPGVQKQHIPSVLKEYDSIRAPRASSVILASQRAGRIYDSFHKPEDREHLKEQLSGIWEEVWHHDVVKDLELAFERLEGCLIPN